MCHMVISDIGGGVYIEFIIEFITKRILTKTLE